MEKLNKIESKIYWIFIISLIVDNLNGFLLLNDIDLPISIGQMYRYIMILFFLYYIISSKNQKTLVKILVSIVYLTLLSILYFIEHTAINGLVMDVTYIIKLIFPFIIISALYLLNKEKQVTSNAIERIFKTFSIFAPLTLIIPRVLNIGFDAYDLGGYKGFYFANNEINVLLVCTFIYSMDQLYQNKKIKDVFVTIINAGALFLIGSKTSIIVIGITLLIYIFKFRKNKKWLLGIVITSIIVAIIGSIVFFDQIQEMIIRFTYFYTTLSKNGGILSFLMSNRNLRIIPAFQDNILNIDIIQGIINFLFGIGRYQQVDPNNLNTLMELDLFDTLYWYGFITAIVVLKKYLQPIIKSIKIKGIFKYKLMFFVVFAFSMIAGHVWYSALAGGVIALINAMLLMKTNEEKNDAIG